MAGFCFHLCLQNWSPWIYPGVQGCTIIQHLLSFTGCFPKLVFVASRRVRPSTTDFPLFFNIIPVLKIREQILLPNSPVSETYRKESDFHLNVTIFLILMPTSVLLQTRFACYFTHPISSLSDVILFFKFVAKTTGTSCRSSVFLFCLVFFSQRLLHPFCPQPFFQANCQRPYWEG